MSTPDDDVLLETRRLGKVFGGVEAVVEIDFRLRRGELRCLIGPNGAGKSTFFKLLTGQLRPSRGVVLFEGVDITGLAQHQIARVGIGIKNQVPSVWDGLGVAEHLWIAARRRHGSARATKLTRALLERLHLADKAERTVGALAHGDRQWVEIGMVVAQEPKLMLLDEPTAGMSGEDVDRTAALLRDINRTTAMIVVEHDMQFIQQIADVVSVLDRGRILIEDSMTNLIADPRVRDVYLGASHA